jgi:hypothetical protein
MIGRIRRRTVNLDCKRCGVTADLSELMPDGLCVFAAGPIAIAESQPAFLRQTSAIFGTIATVQPAQRP